MEGKASGKTHLAGFWIERGMKRVKIIDHNPCVYTKILSSFSLVKNNVLILPNVSAASKLHTFGNIILYLTS